MLLNEWKYFWLRISIYFYTLFLQRSPYRNSSCLESIYCCEYTYLLVLYSEVAISWMNSGGSIFNFEFCNSQGRIMRLQKKIKFTILQFLIVQHGTLYKNGTFLILVISITTWYLNLNRPVVPDFTVYIWPKGEPCLQSRLRKAHLLRWH